MHGHAAHALLIITNLLDDGTTRELVPSLPGRLTDERNTGGIGEDGLDVLEGLTGGFGEHEEDVQEHGGTEDTEENVDLPLDVDEGRGHEVAEREVEGPVGGGAQRVGLATDAKGEQLGRVSPRGGTPGDGVAGDEEVGRGDDSLAGGATNDPRLGFDAFETARGSGVTVRGHETGVDVHPDHHEDGADHKGVAATPAVTPDEGGDGHDNVDDVLDTGGDEQVVALQTGHGEDVGNVVHHDVHTRHLGPDLGEDTDVRAVDHRGFEQLQVANVGVVALELAHVLDLIIFQLHERGVRVALAVDQGQNSVALLPAVLTCQPTGRLRQDRHSEEEENGRDHLKAPGDTEGGGAVNEAAAVGDATHIDVRKAEI